MIRKGILIFLTFFSTALSAQQRPHYTQYMQNMFVINPALSGMYSALEFRAGFRNQWMGFENAPKTSYLTVSTPINFDRDILTAGSADFGVVEPATRSDRDGYYSSSSHHGLGLIALNDETGPFNRASINLSYAYHIAVGDMANLSVGVGGGVSRIGLNSDELRFEDPNDQVVTQGQITKLTPDLNAGFYFYSAQFYFGGSIQQIVKQKLSFNENFDRGAEVSHYFLTAGFRLWFGEDISVTPSIMLRNVKPLPLGLDTNLKIAFRNNIWIGGSYRKKDSFSGMMGFTISKSLDAGYAYDLTTSPIRTVSSGTHEFVLGLKL